MQCNMNPLKYEGVILDVIYHSDESGYSVLDLEIPAEESSPFNSFITCTGYILDPKEGETLKVEGVFKEHPRYGKQLAFTKYERVDPINPSSVERYLSSGVIPGMGAATAKQIVSKFKEETFNVIENFPGKLAEIKGISMKKALQFSESFHATREQRTVMLFLQENGLSPKMAMKVYKYYKDESIELIKHNPYKLADDIDGIGFKRADMFARKMGISPDAPERIQAGIRFALWEATNEGHTYLPQSVLIKIASEMLVIPEDNIIHCLEGMQIDRTIIKEVLEDESDARIFVSPLYYAENNVSAKLTKLAGSVFEIESAEMIDALEISSGINLSQGQKEAVKAALTQGVLIITGGPGTGKTTTINNIIGALEHKGYEITLAAPTGRAAKRMTEATGRDAKTIHRLLEVSFISVDSRRQSFKKNEESPIETDVLIIDEISMIDILLMQHLLKAVAEGTRLILVGDVDQLPSIGSGNVLNDLISSNTLPVCKLTEVFRQAAESAIIMNAHRINKGEQPALNDKTRDFFFVKRLRQPEAEQTILDLITKRLPSYMELDPLKDIQVLSPMRKNLLGVQNLNQIMQKELNPPHPSKREREHGRIIYREGDKVMQIKNNYDAKWEIQGKGRLVLDFGEGVYNGDVGFIEKIEDDIGITIRFEDDKISVYDFTRLDELEPAFAFTVHKSQGSEYKVVIIPVVSGPPMLMTRNLLYTAVTRAKSLCVLVGCPDTLAQMVANNRVTKRYTALWQRLQTMSIKI